VGDKKKQRKGIAGKKASGKTVTQKKRERGGEGDRKR